MTSPFPSCPASLKSIQHYLKTASEHDQRDAVISYWCRLYALQCGLKIDRKSDEAKALLSRLMDWLEAQKKALSDNEAITNDIAAQAHIENYALKVFVYADTQDRAGNFGKNIVKAFYTAGMLFDVLQTFGELTEEVVQNRKYAKWKAAYIHNCLKNGETPIPGPIRNEDEAEDEDMEEDSLGAVGGAPLVQTIGFVRPAEPPRPPASFSPPPSNPGHGSARDPLAPAPGTYFPPAPAPSGYPSTPSDGQSDDLATLNAGYCGPSLPGPIRTASGTYAEGSVVLKPEQITKAQKYCKWAGSALNYDDVPTAISNLQKALTLLQTGVDS